MHNKRFCRRCLVFWGWRGGVCCEFTGRASLRGRGGGTEVVSCSCAMGLKERTEGRARYFHPWNDTQPNLRRLPHCWEPASGFLAQQLLSDSISEMDAVRLGGPGPGGDGCSSQPGASAQRSGGRWSPRPALVLWQEVETRRGRPGGGEGLTRPPLSLPLQPS